MRVGPPEEWQTGGMHYENPNELCQLLFQFPLTLRKIHNNFSVVCHIAIRQSRKRRGTISLTIKDFHFESPFEMNTCGAYSAVIDVKGKMNLNGYRLNTDSINSLFIQKQMQRNTK